MANDQEKREKNSNNKGEEMDQISNKKSNCREFKINFRSRRRKSGELTKPHFKIDWRQLTYYHKNDSCSSSWLMNKLANLSPFKRVIKQDNSNNEQTSDFDELSIHSTTSSYFNNSSSDERSSNIEFPINYNNHGQIIGKSKRILNSLDGSFKSGELSAILGPSGAGKSTFLSTLFGSKQQGAYGQTKVSWFVDSDEEASAMTRRRLRIAFLPQHDHLLHHLTVYETLLFASKIKNRFDYKKRCLENGKSAEAEANFHRQNVKRVAKMLRLNDCLDTRCGQLSGGQYKRVSIAQELLSNPDVMILDEPTSGLDAMTCLTTIMTLKSIVSKHPMSIILTIHQPDMDVFNIFDHIYVIAQGGMAIYEGPPKDLVGTLAEVNLVMPSAGYNPARFIVENAFLVPEAGLNLKNSIMSIAGDNRENAEIESFSSSSSDDDEAEDFGEKCLNQKESYVKRSLLSLTEVISGREIVSGQQNKKDKKPLLNLGIRTLDGKLITSKQLAKSGNNKSDDALLEQYSRERLSLLKRLNMIQKAKHYSDSDKQERLEENNQLKTTNLSISIGDTQKHQAELNGESKVNLSPGSASSATSSSSSNPASDDDYQRSRKSVEKSVGGASSSDDLDASAERKSAKSDYSSAAGWSEDQQNHAHHRSTSDDGRSDSPISSQEKPASLSTFAPGTGSELMQKNDSKNEEQIFDEARYVLDLRSHLESRKSEIDRLSPTSGEASSTLIGSSNSGSQRNRKRSSRRQHSSLKRQFDKRLSSKHTLSKYRDYPIWYHAMVLTHRTWLSIIRDPIFFGIQAVMHTTIPILLSLIFGSVQEEGCPRIGNFDLVEFAYSDSDNMIQGTVRSIRQSIGNIGIVFFEMFVLSFSINCITALVFPLDMHVLLKEYRNGWYSLRSYFIGRTLADLPIPIVLHSIGMSILYYLTGQPNSIWRYSLIIILVILCSLVAQSIGLTIGALLMESSQSAVLAAAGIVAPFFALSGFIVRMHTLPIVAQIGAKLSYLYHLLNAFIILRYGFGRCQCKEEDFESNEAHQIPSNLHTMASMWIGTYSNEFTESSSIMKLAQANQTNRTNIDPNIDVVDKMMVAFKMANSYGHKIESCKDVLPYAMLDFNLKESDVYTSFLVIILMLIISRFITFSAIYYKIRSFA